MSEEVPEILLLNVLTFLTRYYFLFVALQSLQIITFPDGTESANPHLTVHILHRTPYKIIYEYTFASRLCVETNAETLPPLSTIIFSYHFLSGRKKGCDDIKPRQTTSSQRRLVLSEISSLHLVLQYTLGTFLPLIWLFSHFAVRKMMNLRSPPSLRPVIHTLRLFVDGSEIQCDNFHMWKEKKANRLRINSECTSCLLYTSVLCSRPTYY